MRLLDRERLTYRSDGLDLMRALLALWVVFGHLAVWGALTDTGSPGFLQAVRSFTGTTFQQHGETHPAVLAFIVLSGYCIHRAGARSDGWSARRYAVKRAYRIWPVYVAASLAGAAAFGAAAQASAPVTQQITATESFSTGCLAAKLSGVSAFVPSLHGCAFQGNAPLATVMVEIWLYVAYGVVAALLLRGVRERAVWAAIGGVYLGGFAVVSANPELASWWANGSFAGFLLYWWLGAALVAREWNRRSSIVLIAAALTFAATTLATFDSFALAEMHKLSFAALVGCAIWAVDRRVRALPRPLTLLGQSGYSLYAFHAPVLVLLVTAGVAWPIVLVAPVCVGLVSFLLFERPLMLRGRALAARAPARLPPPVPVRSEAA